MHNPKFSVKQTMAKRFSILKKSNGSEIHPFLPTTHSEDELNEKTTTKHTWKIFKVLSKTWKSGKGKGASNDTTEHFRFYHYKKLEQDENTLRENSSSSSSGQVINKTEMNPFADSRIEFDQNSTSTKNSSENDDASKFGRNLLNKMNLQKLLGLFASANRKRQELLKHKTNKNEAVHLDKAKTFIFGQGPFRQEENEIDATSLLTDEEQDLYDINYENSAPSTSRLSRSSMSITNVSMKTKLSVDYEQFASTSTPANSPQDQIQTASAQPGAVETDAADADEEGAAQSETLDLLQSVCDRLVSHDFNTSANSSSLNINANEKVVENKSGSLLNMDLESDSAEEDSDSESPNSRNSATDTKEIAINNENTAEDIDKVHPENFLESPKNEESVQVIEEEKKCVVIGDAKDLGKTQIRLNTIQNLYTCSFNTRNAETLPVIKEKSQSEIRGGSSEVRVKEERTDNQKTYSIVEDDIKCMIQELLNESKTIKETILSSGITEEAEPPFTYSISQNLSVEEICKSICEELINTATTTAYNKTFNIPNRKNIFTSKEGTSTAMSDVTYVMTILLEQVFSKLPNEKLNCEPNKHFIPVNYCLVNDRETSLRNSKIYSTGNKFWQTNKNHNPKRVCTPRLPLVTIRNLSSAPRISVFKTDDKLVNRVRKSAALLLALYEEMRDYSYQNTSRLFNDLYETINLLDLSKYVVEHPKPNRLIEKKSASQVNNGQFFKGTNPNSEPAINPVTEKKEVPEGKPEEPESSCSKSTSKNSFDIPPSCSDSSLCSSEINDDAETCSILPNLKYTYMSDEEINSAEEIKKIETNATENSMRNANLRITDKKFSMELDDNDDEATNSYNEVYYSDACNDAYSDAFNDDEILIEDKSYNSNKDGGNL